MSSCDRGLGPRWPRRAAASSTGRGDRSEDSGDSGGCPVPVLYGNRSGDRGRPTAFRSHLPRGAPAHCGGIRSATTRGERVMVEGGWSGTAASPQAQHAGPSGKRHCRCHGPCRAQLRYREASAKSEAASLPRCRSCLSIPVRGRLLCRSAEVYRGTRSPSMNSLRTLGRRASFWVAAAVVAHTLWTSAAPSMTYPLYASEWGLTHTATTAIFAVFPIVVVAVLLFSGGISDYIGRRSTILIGLSSSLLGTALFAIAPSVLWVFVGRAFIGLGVGLCAGPAAAALLEFSAVGEETRASSITTLAQAVGIVLATIVGGALIQYAPYPTHLNFWVLLVVLAILFVVAWFLPRPVSNKAQGRWQPKLPSIPREIRKIFAASAIAAGTGYVIGGLMLSLGAQH